MATTIGMLVSGDPTGRKAMAEQLRRRGLYVVEADSVGEAVQLAQFGGLHVVIATLSADPTLDLCHQLRSSATTAHLPVVVVGTVPDEQGHALRDVGTCTWVSGPNPDELLEVIQRADAATPTTHSPVSETN